MKEYIVKADFITEDDELVSPDIVSELIRCKDCKHRDEENANCTRFRKDWYVQSNSFCSWAEPKVNDDNS